MPPAGLIVVCAFAAAGYFYVGKPIAHETKKASHKVCHALTLGKECKSTPKKEKQ